MREQYLKILGLDVLQKKGLFPAVCMTEGFSEGKADEFNALSPVHQEVFSSFKAANKEQVKEVLTKAQDAFTHFQMVPAPKRGELVREIAQLARQKKEALAYLVTMESGKIKEEALGEVQEFIDVCDFAVGLSRQLYGLSIASERYKHKMIEQWHPLGVIGVISAFNFPVAVWAWNAMLALVCGNAVVWKPSSKTPLCALACHMLIQEALSKVEGIPANISSVVIGSKEVGEVLSDDTRIRLLSATGSVAMGKEVAPRVAKRLGRVLLELGGNNAMIVSKEADLKLALRAIVFSAVGTAGQRCTSLRRLFVHKSIKEKLIKQLVQTYKSIRIGNPNTQGVLMGPLVDKNSYEKMQETLVNIQKEGGCLLYGGERLYKDVPEGGFYVTPALVSCEHTLSCLQEEVFAPLLYVIEYESFEEALQMHNAVPQGLSSAVFTNNLKEAELFMSPKGSDCGIANVNIGTSGAEIGGAFGGEKETGGGRESGSDAWKNYMRRVTNTINYSDNIPLAQGIHFPIE